MIQAVLFEFDGVIADTGEGRRDALRQALEQDGVTISDAEYEEWCAALPVRSAVRAALSVRAVHADETTISLVSARAERNFGALVEAGLTLAIGARALIETMHGHTRLGIVSRAARRDIETTLSMAQLDSAFEFVVSDDDPFPPKPSSEPYLAALTRLARRRAVVAKNVVALEDGAAGIRAAKGAGLRCAVVGSVPVHVAISADGLVSSLVGLTAASIDAVTLGQRVAER